MKVKIGLTKDQALKIGKVAGYIAVSAVISYLISLVANDSNLIGPLTPLVNFMLVSLQQFIKAPEE